MSETPKKAKKYGNQVHLRLGDDLVTAIEGRATEEGISVTALMIKAAKQYLGWEKQPSQATINIDEVEERLFQRLSAHWVSFAIDLEEKIHKNVSERIPELDLSEIESRISEHVLECVSQRVSSLIHTQNEETLDTGSLSEAISDTGAAEVQNGSVSSRNTKIHIDHESIQSNAFTPQESVTEIIPTSTPLPFDLIMSEGQTVKPSEVARYLREIEQDPTWELHKVRRLKNKQLTYLKDLKKPTGKKKSEPPLPMITNEYLIDWNPSEAFENLDNITSSGKLWWIQRLPSNPDEAKKLIITRRELWNSQP